MSKTSISTKNQNLLWAMSAGRCEYEGCNKVLHIDILTKKKYNNAYIAHIVADEPNGPRGDAERSKLLSDDVENLMLLCDEHHRLIDKEDVAGNPESRLLEMKKKHEDRIKRLTSISPDLSSNIILYGANIGKHNSPLSYQIASEAMFPDYYPAFDSAIELGMKNTPFSDDIGLYWAAEEDNLNMQFNQKIKSQLMLGNAQHYSLFALAPQPLLIKLGSLLNDIHNLKVYQKHREPSTWKWQQTSTNATFSLIEPVDKKQTPVLVLSISATVNDDSIKMILGEGVSIWKITVDEPDNDFLKSEKLLSDFRIIVRRTFDLIKSNRGCVELHVFPAMPVSASVEFGRVWMPKADMPLVIYDENKSKGGFYKTITIN